MTKTEYLVKNYADLGGCYHSADNILLELHNGSYYTELLSVCVKYSTVCALVMRFQLANDQHRVCYYRVVPNKRDPSGHRLKSGLDPGLWILDSGLYFRYVLYRKMWRDGGWVGVRGVW